MKLKARLDRIVDLIQCEYDKAAEKEERPFHIQHHDTLLLEDELVCACDMTYVNHRHIQSNRNSPSNSVDGHGRRGRGPLAGRQRPRRPTLPRPAHDAPRRFGASIDSVRRLE